MLHSDNGFFPKIGVAGTPFRTPGGVLHCRTHKGELRVIDETGTVVTRTTDPAHKEIACADPGQLITQLLGYEPHEVQRSTTGMPGPGAYHMSKGLRVKE